jgi:tetratricopeptide (TPR) repeat protein
MAISSRRVGLATSALGLLLASAPAIAEDGEAYAAGIEAGRAGDFTRAEQLFQQALVADPLHIPSKRALELLADRSSAYVQDPTVILLFNGLAFQAREDWERAEGEFGKALERDPTYYFALHNFATARYQNGDDAGSIAGFLKVLELRPDYVYALNNLGLAYARIGEHEKACEQLRKVVELDPTYYKAYNNLAASLRALGKHEEAEATLRTALETSPAYSAAASNLAWGGKGAPAPERVPEDLPTGTLLELLETGSWEDRTQATERLLRRNDPESLPRLLGLLGHERTELRAAAAKLVAGLRSAAAFDALAALLARDREWVVRYEASTALFQLGDPRAVAPLVQALRDDKAPQVRRNAAYGLRAYAVCEAAQALVRAQGDPVAEVRRSAADSLAALSGQVQGQDPRKWEQWVAATCAAASR